MVKMGERMGENDRFLFGWWGPGDPIRWAHSDGRMGADTTRATDGREALAQFERMRASIDPDADWEFQHYPDPGQRKPQGPSVLSIFRREV